MLICALFPGRGHGRGSFSSPCFLGLGGWGGVPWGCHGEVDVGQLGRGAHADQAVAAMLSAESLAAFGSNEHIGAASGVANYSHEVVVSARTKSCGFAASERSTFEFPSGSCVMAASLMSAGAFA